MVRSSGKAAQLCAEHAEVVCAAQRASVLPRCGDWGQVQALHRSHRHAWQPVVWCIQRPRASASDTGPARWATKACARGSAYSLMRPGWLPCKAGEAAVLRQACWGPCTHLGKRPREVVHPHREQGERGHGRHVGHCAGQHVPALHSTRQSGRRACSALNHPADADTSSMGLSDH